MEEIIVKINTDMVIERIPFPVGKTPEVFNKLTGLIGNDIWTFDDYRLDRLSSLIKQDVLLLTDFFPEQKAGYNRMASYLLANASEKTKGLPIWGNALLVKRTFTDPNDRFHFTLGGFSGISLDILEMYILAAKKQIADAISPDAGEKLNEGIKEPETVTAQSRRRIGRLSR